MLLKRITLNNFRQFRGKHTIEFSTDSEKNVTVIIGENGSGKTTLAQAFTWCLYGSTDFKNKSVLNLAYEHDMKPLDSATVFVELVLEHTYTDDDGKQTCEYTIVRNQGYQKDRTNITKPSPTKLTVHYKNKDGQTKPISDILSASKVNEILPQNLSRYFFFDGERIEKMSDDIQSGKSPEFADAVKRLLGLNTYDAAIRHIGGDKRAGSRSSVIGSYNSAYDASNDSKITEHSKEYDRLQDEINKLNSRKDAIEKELPFINSECEKLAAKIAENRDGERLQSDCDRKRRDINNNNASIDASTEKILYSFKNNYRSFFYRKLVGDSLEVLVDTDKVDKGVPDIRDKTILYLFNRGFCICGNKICDGSAERKALEDLLNYIPPQSLSTTINAFATECKRRTEHGDDIFKAVSEILSEVEQKRLDNETIKKEIEALEERIKSFESIGQYQTKLNSYKNDRQKKQGELSEIISKISKHETDRDRHDTERKRLALQSDNNKKIAIYASYTQKIYDILLSDYKEREKVVRKNLESAINNIFLTIYNGGLSLKIDSKYNIQTIISDESSYNGTLDDTSTAQSIAVIFAFIAGVIKVAREAKQDNNSYDLSADAYPLVMDAPLSAFDKRRIKTVCETLPEIAEQVIIFIKDTDGEIAEKYLSEKIGASYEFDKKSETETCFKERS